MTEPVVIKAETCNGDTYEIRYYRASDYDALAARLAEAEALLRDTVHPTQYAVIRPGWVYRRDAFLTPDSASAVQPERCCLDYPRCDCNSPPEPDNAPTLQPCGHPWKAQHNFKCILCSSPGTALVKANE